MEVANARGQGMQQPTDSTGRGCTGEISHAKVKTKSFGFTYKRKIEAKKRHKAQFVPPPKSVISTFDDGGQYSPVIIILRCYHRVLPALGKWHVDFACACHYVAKLGVPRAQPHKKVILVTKKN